MIRSFKKTGLSLGPAGGSRDHKYQIRGFQTSKSMGGSNQSG